MPENACLPGHAHLGAQHPPLLRPLVYALALTAAFCLVELGGGLWTKSLALIADSMHMAVDVIALGLALFAALVSSRPADERRTFGYKRIEVLAALGNGMGLLILTGFILREAVIRLAHPTAVKAYPMMWIALFGLASNLASGFFLYSPSRDNINLRGAFLHVAADALGSLAALTAAVLILKAGLFQADAAASLIISGGIVLTAFWLMRDSVNILLESAPAHLNIEDIRGCLSSIDGVREVHDLHLWSLSPGFESMSGHLVADPAANRDEVLRSARDELKGRFGLFHVTLQIEGNFEARKK